jgi:hypothetical protein
MSKPLDPNDQLSEEPIDEDTADEWDEERIDIIGPNGNTGDHYHLGCPAYPNCDIDPQGCRHATDNVDFYGHRN